MSEAFIVTVRLGKHWNGRHDPQAKIQGICLPDTRCTDKTGEHHSFVTVGESLESVREAFERDGNHVTRVEDATWVQLPYIDDRIA